MKVLGKTYITSPLRKARYSDVTKVLRSGGYRGTTCWSGMSRESARGKWNKVCIPDHCFTFYCSLLSKNYILKTNEPWRKPSVTENE